MKLRIRDNSVRLRLAKNEVARLRETGSIEASTEFGPDPNQRLNYALVNSDEARNISARYEDGRVTVLLPGALAKQWVESDQVGLEGEQSLGGANVLKILVEKDFTCLTKREGDEDLDTFPHPQEGMLCA